MTRGNFTTAHVWSKKGAIASCGHEPFLIYPFFVGLDALLGGRNFAPAHFAQKGGDLGCVARLEWDTPRLLHRVRGVVGKIEAAGGSSAAGIDGAVRRRTRIMDNFEVAIASVYAAEISVCMHLAESGLVQRNTNSTADNVCLVACSPKLRVHWLPTVPIRDELDTAGFDLYSISASS